MNAREWLNTYGADFGVNNINIIGEDTKLTTTGLRDIIAESFSAMMGDEMA